MATGVIEGALAQARGTVGGALAQGYSHALERVIEEAVGEEGRAVARQGMWEGHVAMLLPSVWAEAVEGPGVGEACVVVARETLEGQRKEWALACSTTQHVMQQLLDAIIHTNNAQASTHTYSCGSGSKGRKVASDFLPSFSLVCVDAGDDRWALPLPGLPHTAAGKRH
jgi:hypothetical protein